MVLHSYSASTGVLVMFQKYSVSAGKNDAYTDSSKSLCNQAYNHPFLQCFYTHKINFRIPKDIMFNDKLIVQFFREPGVNCKKI